MQSNILDILSQRDKSEWGLQKLKFKIKTEFSKKVFECLEFSEKIHILQNRHNSCQKYLFHLIEVMQIVALFNKNEPLLCASLLHDSVEYGKTTFTEIKNKFGSDVAKLVFELTNPDRVGPVKGNLDYIKSLKGSKTLTSGNSQTIKYAEFISNIYYMYKNDRNYAKEYLESCYPFIEDLKDGNKKLFDEIVDFLPQLKQGDS